MQTTKTLRWCSICLVLVLVSGIYLGCGFESSAVTTRSEFKDEPTPSEPVAQDGSVVDLSQYPKPPSNNSGPVGGSCGETHNCDPPYEPPRKPSNPNPPPMPPPLP